jgi:hypothetical protein
MPRHAWIELGAINVSASPHPDGVYRQMLLAAANKDIEVFGDDFAKITEASERDPGIFIGRILVWTKIDKGGDWVNLQKNQKASEQDKSKIVLVPTIQPNYKSFQFAFIEKKHWLVVEYKNELRQRFSPKRAERFFRNLFSRDILGEEFPDIEITVIPDEDSLARLLSIEHLRRLKIVIVRPNPDDMGDHAEEVLASMEQNGAGQYAVELAKARGISTLTPSPKTLNLAEIATTNGYVQGEGRNGDTPVFESTKDHPQVYKIKVPAGSSFSAEFFSAIKSFF